MPIFKENGGVLEELKNEETSDTAAVTDDNDISGEKEQDVTDPASEPETDADADGEVANSEKEDESSDGEAVSDDVEAGVQSKAENRRQAAARREREAAEERTAAQDEVVKAMGIFNPVTGKNCETFEEYTSMQKNAAQSKIREQLAAHGIDTDAIDKLVAEHPAVKEAKRVIDEAKAAEIEAKKATDNAKFDKLLADVSSVIPDIKEAGDLFKWKHFDMFSILVNGGISPLEAAETLAGNSRAKAARQAAINDIVSKSHLVKTKTTNSGGDYGITDVEYAIMQASVPGISRKDAAAKIKKYGI